MHGKPPARGGLPYEHRTGRSYSLLRGHGPVTTMRRLAIVLVVALCGSAAEATERKRGHGDGRMYRPGLFGGNAAAASLLENPLACTTVIVAGQSLGDGVCSGGTCAAQSVTPQQDFMLDNDEVELCALREGGGGAHSSTSSLSSMKS